MTDRNKLIAMIAAMMSPMNRIKVGAYAP
jgi:hypothetical protein